MKTPTFLTLPNFTAFEGALLKSHNVALGILCLSIVTLWNTHSVTAAPTKLDSLESTFALNLQPPIFEATASASSPPTQPNGPNDGSTTTVDSYGNPIVSLQPIQTPDGRKVVSAQGLQFEIPNYASGITELKKPSDDLLPPFVDKIASGSSSEEDNFQSTNPFLRRFDDGSYKPQPTSRRTTYSANASTSTSTTTTTAAPPPAPLIIEKNPFEATIPPWLKEFDYPDLGPGVPFIYDPNEDEMPVDKNILPPSNTDDDPNPSKLNSNHPFFNAQTPQGFTNKFSTTDLSLTSSSSIPSITTIPFPSAQETNQDDSTLTRPPLVFVPPTSITAAEANDDISIKTSTTFNKHFPAPFDNTGSSSSTITSDQKKVPLSADRESFPPFNNIIIGSSTTPSKTTFSKSQDGKVISNNIFLNGGITASSIKPIGSSRDQNSFTTQSSTGSSPLTTSSAASAFVTSSSSSFGSSTAHDGSKYTGRFGGPPGILAPQVNGFAASNSAVTKPAVGQPAITTFSGSSSKRDNRDKFVGSFGGPPGVLKPYDNVKNR